MHGWPHSSCITLLSWAAMLVAAPSPAASAAAAHLACLCCLCCPVVWPLSHSACFVAVLLAGAASPSCLVCWAAFETATVSTQTCRRNKNSSNADIQSKPKQSWTCWAPHVLTCTEQDYCKTSVTVPGLSSYLFFMCTQPSPYAAGRTCQALKAASTGCLLQDRN